MKALEAGDATEASGLTVVDDQTLSMKLEKFTPTWALQLAVWMFGVYSADQAESDPETFRIAPIGAGPYKATYDDATDTQYYDRAEHYWGDSPKIDRVVRPTVRDLQTGYLLYENGELDVLYADSVRQPAIWQPDNPFHGDLVLQGGKGLWYTAFVTDHPPFDDLNVRKAFSLGANMWEIVPAILGPKAQYGGGILTEGNACSQYPDVGYPYDPEAARAALAASKYGSAENVRYSDARDFPPVDHQHLRGGAGAVEGQPWASRSTWCGWSLASSGEMSSSSGARALVAAYPIRAAS